MASPSLEYFNNMWQYVPQGHEKALKQAFYNTAATIFIIVAGAAVIAVYFILNPFLKPLCWALLCGTFLYPFKRSLTNVLKSWLQGLNSSSTPFAVGVVILPLKLVDATSDALSSGIKRHFKLIVGVVLGLPILYLLYHFGPVQKILSFVQLLLFVFHEILGYFSSLWVWTLFIAYLLVLVFYWTPESNKQLKYLAIPVWIAFILHVATIAGPLRVPLLIFMVMVMIIGFVAEINQARKQQSLEGDDNKDISPATAALTAIFYSQSSSEMDTTGITAESPEHPATPGEKKESKPPPVPAKPKTLPMKESSLSSTEVTPAKSDSSPPAPEEERSLTTQCFIALFWAHVLVRLWMHVWIILLLFLLPLVLMLVKVLGAQLGSEGLLRERIKCVRKTFFSWIEARQDVLAPRSIRGLGKLAIRGDRKIISVLEMSLDKATSIILILLLLIGSVLFLLIGAIQIHQESMHLITMTSNLLNNTVNPEISQWLPNGEDMQKAMDSMVGNAYVYGRDWIASMVHDLVTTEGSNNTHLEAQVLEMVDQLYESWFAKNTTSVSRRSPQGFPDVTNMTAMWEVVSQGGGLLNLSSAMAFVQDNIGTFMSVLESIWAVIKGNMNLVVSMLTATLSLVFGGGTAILNFVISAILFLTTLFYLLASSGNQYKPVEWFTSMSPSSGSSGGSSGKPKIGQAVEEAITGVFMASLKMAAFYGGFTWLTHLVFGVNIVFIPSALAAIFAAIPFVGTYWAALPAMLELWLVQGQGLLALLMLVVHMLPAYVVDTAIYSEIKGGHPFMTGLAIAGGMYCLGLEGAIIGPIVLCCMIVVINIYGTMLQPDPTTPQAGPSRSVRMQ